MVRPSAAGRYHPTMARPWEWWANAPLTPREQTLANQTCDPPINRRGGAGRPADQPTETEHEAAEVER